MIDTDFNNESYYADTAYDSRKFYKRIDPSDIRWTPHRMNGHMLKWGVEFGLFQSVSEEKPSYIKKIKEGLLFNYSSEFKDYKDNRSEWPQELRHADHWAILSIHTWAVGLQLICGLSIVLLVIWPVAMLLLCYSEGGWGPLVDLDLYIAWGGAWFRLCYSKLDIKERLGKA